MNLFADECVDGCIVERLREDGHSVLYITEMAAGIPDEEVLKKSNENNSLLLTIDKDFGELVFRKKMVNNGVLLIRLEGLPATKKADIVSDAIKNHGEKLMNSFSVITPKSIRIRNVYYQNS